MRPAGNREHSFENSFEGHLPLPLGAASGLAASGECLHRTGSGHCLRLFIFNGPRLITDGGDYAADVAISLGRPIGS